MASGKYFGLPRTLIKCRLFFFKNVTLFTAVCLANHYILPNNKSFNLPLLNKIEHVINDVMIFVIFHDVKIQKKIDVNAF